MTLFFNPVTFVLLGARIIGLFLMLPGVNENNVPRIVRLGAVIWITVLLAPLVPAPPASVLLQPADAVYRVACELLVGLGQGLIVRVIFSGFQFGGAIVDSELGFLAAQQINPFNPLSGGVFVRFFMFAALFYFWALDYLPLLLVALRESFEVLPLGSFDNPTGDIRQLVRLAGGTFVAAVVLSAPVVALNFCVTVSLGFLARAVQGINIFFENFTFKLLIGVAGVTLIFLPLMLYIIRVQMERILPETTEYLRSVIQANT